ncbi:Dihydrolipoamide dehydrogenase of pyruvate dehydrogenase complex (EC 1.8.1.4), partial [uncultured Gammaproteobacteria bacterium]
CLGKIPNKTHFQILLSLNTNPYQSLMMCITSTPTQRCLRPLLLLLKWQKVRLRIFCRRRKD